MVSSCCSCLTSVVSLTVHHRFKIRNCHQPATEKQSFSDKATKLLGPLWVSYQTLKKSKEKQNNKNTHIAYKTSRKGTLHMRKQSVRRPCIYHTDRNYNFKTTRIAFRKLRFSVVVVLLSDEQNHFTVTKYSNKNQWTIYVGLRSQPKFWPRISQLLGHSTETARFTRLSSSQVPKSRVLQCL